MIIGLRNADGSPPYIVRWLSDGHIALFFPGPYTKVVRAGTLASVRSRAQGE